MTLLLRPSTEPAKRRNKTGISRIFLRNMYRGEKVTLSQAIALLKAKW